jgi:ATP-dependent protease ClpP protease subunit
MYALQQPGHNDWYRIRNQTTGPAQLHIYDEIGYFGVTAQDMIRDLAEIEGDLEVHISSPGGEVFDGIAIYNTLKQRHPTIIIDSLAASIASVIAMAAAPGKLLISKNAQMMIHDGHGMAIGNAADMRELADMLDRTSNNIASIYSDRTGKPEAFWRQLMKDESWYSGQEAVDAGLADALFNVPAVVTDQWDMTIFKNQQAGTKVEDAASVPYVGRGEARHVPTTTTHTHDHATHGADDGDDGIHSHSHDHSNDANHDHTHVHGHDHDDQGSMYDEYSADGSPVGETARHFYAASDSGSWDGSAAMSAAANSDNPASAYASICAGRRSGDRSKGSTWALPHHSKPGGPANGNGVKNALARLSSTQGLVNAAAAKRHLESHMREINPDYKSSDSLDLDGDYSDEEVQSIIKNLREVTI